MINILSLPKSNLIPLGVDFSFYFTPSTGLMEVFLFDVSINNIIVEKINTLEQHVRSPAFRAHNIINLLYDNEFNLLLMCIGV